MQNAFTSPKKNMACHTLHSHNSSACRDQASIQGRLQCHAAVKPAQVGAAPVLSGVAECESQAGSRQGHQNMQEFEFVFWYRHGWKKSPHSMAGCLTRTQRSGDASRQSSSHTPASTLVHHHIT